MCITYEYLLKYVYDDCDYGMAIITGNTNWLNQLTELAPYARSMRGR